MAQWHREPFSSKFARKIQITNYELSHKDRSRAETGLKISLKVCRTICNVIRSDQAVRIEITSKNINTWAKMTIFALFFKVFFIQTACLHYLTVILNCIKNL